jgi:hypothetical protein
MVSWSFGENQLLAGVDLLCRSSHCIVTTVWENPKEWGVIDVAVAREERRETQEEWRDTD